MDTEQEQPNIEDLGKTLCTFFGGKMFLLILVKEDSEIHTLTNIKNNGHFSLLQVLTQSHVDNQDLEEVSRTVFQELSDNVANYGGTDHHFLKKAVETIDQLGRIMAFLYTVDLEGNLEEMTNSRENRDEVLLYLFNTRDSAKKQTLQTIDPLGG